MKSRKHLTTLSNAETAAAKYLALEEEMRVIRDEQNRLKNTLKDYLSSATPTSRAILRQREFYLCTQVREIFDLKRARKVLEDRQLKPFVKLSESVSLRHK